MIMQSLPHKINFLLVDYANSYFSPQEKKGNEKDYVKSFEQGRMMENNQRKMERIKKIKLVFLANVYLNYLFHLHLLLPNTRKILKS